ncbi:hypothetical protein J6590_039999 [Homalodisca vitripennis]|nr:hypothetical protein J6590_039999 [Homalodisca vitripennis]
METQITVERVPIVAIDCTLLESVKVGFADNLTAGALLADEDDGDGPQQCTSHHANKLSPDHNGFLQSAYSDTEQHLQLCWRLHLCKCTTKPLYKPVACRLVCPLTPRSGDDAWSSVRVRMVSQGASGVSCRHRTCVTHSLRFCV